MKYIKGYYRKDYEVVVDKGRIVIPKVHLEILHKEGITFNSLLLYKSEVEGYSCIFVKPIIEQIENRINPGGGLYYVNMQKYNRLLIPPELIKEASIDDKAIVTIINSDHMKIWNPKIKEQLDEEILRKYSAEDVLKGVSPILEKIK